MNAVVLVGVDGSEYAARAVQWCADHAGALGVEVVAVLAVEVLQVVVLSGVGLALGWSPTPGVLGLIGFFLAFVLGTAAFVSLGLLLAGTLRAEATLAVANLVYLLLLAGGGVVLPSSSYGAFGELVRWLPSGALGDAIRLAFQEGAVDWAALGCLLAWAALGSLLTARTFKWE